MRQLVGDRLRRAIDRSFDRLKWQALASRRLECYSHKQYNKRYALSSSTTAEQTAKASLASHEFSYGSKHLELNQLNIYFQLKQTNLFLF